MTIRQMTPDDQALLLRLTDIALQWAAGRITFEEVTQRIGKPPDQSDEFDLIRYEYYVNRVMTFEFVYDKLKLVDGKPSLAFFGLEVGSDVHANIPYECFDKLGLHRLVRGETIDGVRRERMDFFVPSGALDITGFYGTDYVSFGYRLPLPPDSLFDVYAGCSYYVEWIDANDAPTLGNIRKAENLRDLGVSRHYLTPQELEQRRQAAQAASDSIQRGPR
ncbi:hypothetical protein [Paraburkholderia antibiotica]|uniref:Uncharacterized protein n=1 Tax=Paraburkholderia antibiotica TaxID=2728839 RepID=A0A7X9ZVZ2_9BURK|nr:hypothetical protein [Paraburkholderia antibiotica]NML30654.1 hypothetical protein [Paraburkholderia antibiotica]